MLLSVFLFPPILIMEGDAFSNNKHKNRRHPFLIQMINFSIKTGGLLMNNQNETVKRQAIKAQKKKQQANILAGIIDNESKTYTFEKTISVGGQKKTGTFKAKYLGVAGRLRIGTIRAKLLDGAPAQSVDTLTDDIAYMIAYLTVALIKAPAWWSYDELDEVSDLRDMYMEVYNFTQSFRAQNELNSNAGNSAAASGQETVENQ